MQALMTKHDLDMVHNEYYTKPLLNTRVSMIPRITNPNLEYVVVNEFVFVIHKNDTCVSDSLRSNQLYEKFFLSFVKQFIDPSKNIIDLGANIGTHSVIFSTYTSGIVYSFEPQKMVYDVLTKNITLNRCDNVRTFNFGGSDKDDLFYMNVDYESKINHGAFRICDKTYIEPNNALKIECKQIDRLNLQNIGFIKIDVEGHEYQCMLGLVNTIQKYNPVIMIEVHDSCPQQADTFNLLYELNYTKYIKLSHCDYVFFKKNSSEDVI
jgi:FkbM family methyltransferase